MILLFFFLNYVYFPALEGKTFLEDQTGGYDVMVSPSTILPARMHLLFNIATIYSGPLLPQIDRLKKNKPLAST